MTIDSQKLSTPLAVFGGIYEADPIDVKGTSREVVKETLYPPLGQLAEHLGFPAEFVYDTLVSKGYVVFMCGDWLVVATQA